MKRLDWKPTLVLQSTNWSSESFVRYGVIVIANLYNTTSRERFIRDAQRDSSKLSLWVGQNETVCALRINVCTRSKRKIHQCCWTELLGFLHTSLIDSNGVVVNTVSTSCDILLNTFKVRYELTYELTRMSFNVRVEICVNSYNGPTVWRQRSSVYGVAKRYTAAEATTRFLGRWIFLW